MIQKQHTTLLYTQCIQYTCTTQIMTPLESTYKQCVGRQSVGAPNNSTVVMSPMLGRKSEDHTNIFVSQTIYFTLLHSLKTRLFINPVLNNPQLFVPFKREGWLCSDHALPYRLTPYPRIPFALQRAMAYRSGTSLSYYAIIHLCPGKRCKMK